MNEIQKALGDDFFKYFCKIFIPRSEGPPLKKSVFEGFPEIHRNCIFKYWNTGIIVMSQYTLSFNYASIHALSPYHIFILIYHG